jgi:hypothetical protein
MKKVPFKLLMQGLQAITGTADYNEATGDVELPAEVEALIAENPNHPVTEAVITLNDQTLMLVPTQSSWIAMELPG